LLPTSRAISHACSSGCWHVHTRLQAECVRPRVTARIFPVASLQYSTGMDGDDGSIFPTSAGYDYVAATVRLVVRATPLVVATGTSTPSGQQGAQARTTRQQHCSSPAAHGHCCHTTVPHGRTSARTVKENRNAAAIWAQSSVTRVVVRRPRPASHFRESAWIETETGRRQACSLGMMVLGSRHQGSRRDARKLLPSDHNQRPVRS
jgi:hypothetical protein